MEILRRKQKEMLEINTAREVENSFDGLICVLNPPEERISGDTSIEIAKTGKKENTQNEKKKRRKNTIFKNWDNYKRYNVYKADTRKQRKTERNRRNIWKKKKSLKFSSN